jgi:hypothetical protein
MSYGRFKRTPLRMAEQLGGPFEKFVDSLYYSAYIFEKWVEHCKKGIACQGRYLEKETVTAPPQIRTRSNKVSPRTFQMALVVNEKHVDVRFI